MVLSTWIRWRSINLLLALSLIFIISVNASSQSLMPNIGPVNQANINSAQTASRFSSTVSAGAYYRDPETGNGRYLIGSLAQEAEAERQRQIEAEAAEAERQRQIEAEAAEAERQRQIEAEAAEAERQRQIEAEAAEAEQKRIEEAVAEAERKRIEDAVAEAERQNYRITSSGNWDNTDNRDSQSYMYRITNFAEEFWDDLKEYMGI